jgi:hypothetical protein
MKGIRYRVGASRGKSVRRSAIKLQSRGTLVLTTAGFTFLSETDSVRIPIRKILALQLEWNSISLHLDYVRNPYAGFDGLSRKDHDFIKRAIDTLTAVRSLVASRNGSPDRAFPRQTEAPHRRPPRRIRLDTRRLLPRLAHNRRHWSGQDGEVHRKTTIWSQSRVKTRTAWPTSTLTF